MLDEEVHDVHDLVEVAHDERSGGGQQVTCDFPTARRLGGRRKQGSNRGHGFPFLERQAVTELAVECLFQVGAVGCSGADGHGENRRDAKTDQNLVKVALVVQVAG